jgi:hypothetical protein
MSFIAGGGANIFIGNGQTQGWVFTWNNGGWQGDTFNQPQPLNTDASLTSSEESVSMNNNGTYSFSYSVTNNGPNTTFYNLQTGSN